MSSMQNKSRPTTGMSEVDKAIGGVIEGDNLVWEVDSGVAGDHFISRFVAACEKESVPVIYISFNRSPQTIMSKYGSLTSPGQFSLIDCFSSGKGNSDEMFLKFFDNSAQAMTHAIHIADPADPSRLEQALVEIGTRSSRSANYVFDSLTGMLDLWGDENRVVRLFGHLCPRLYDLSTLACWLVETEAHSEAFLAKVRHITQVVIEVSLSNGQRALTVRKAAGRNAVIGVAQPLDFDEDEYAPPEGETVDVRGLDRLTRRGEELRRTYRVDSIVGGSAAIRRLLGLAATAARSRSSVLITGETGTGKELIANVVHYNSARASGPMVKVNCGALPETLLETELFGHVKGAFTGAVRDYEGRFRAANGGTLFLDEVSEMSPRLQVKLLRVLQERQLEPVGSSRTLTVDVRIVAATGRDLRAEIKAGRFRHDLFYRLNVIPIQLPPLIERREDIPLLVDHFLEKYNREAGRHVAIVPRETLEALLAYSWPGNVRELENCIERAVVMSPDNRVSLDLLPEEIRDNQSSFCVNDSEYSESDPRSELRQAVLRFMTNRNNPTGIRDILIDTVEETLLRNLVDSGKYSQRELADLLAISRVTLRKKLNQYGIS
jgi:transcriptional regulator with PAS, ATPase and Fis domain